MLSTKQIPLSMFLLLKLKLRLKLMTTTHQSLILHSMLVMTLTNSLVGRGVLNIMDIMMNMDMISSTPMKSSSASISGLIINISIMRNMCQIMGRSNMILLQNTNRIMFKLRGLAHPFKMDSNGIYSLTISIPIIISTHNLNNSSI